ncbi:MAG: M23 family metallopeptidase [Deltaproteobacteria bacterium]|nr:M23 family metallopeptidase [Deltaproteobacteria bacterium]
MTSTDAALSGATAPDEPQQRRGFFDFTLMAVLLYAVYAMTPLGAIAETALNVARGQKQRPSWLATFKGRELATAVDDSAVADASAAEGKIPLPIATAAEKHKIDVEALAALVSVHGSCTPTTCDVTAPPRTSTVFPPVAGKARLSADEAAQAIAAAGKEHGKNAELAVEAMFVGSIPLKLALSQAERSALENGEDVEVHAPFFTPSVRRGSLQGALSVIAVYRLRTLAWPADPGFRITSPFGDRMHPVTGKQAFHNGTDLGTPTGTSLFAAHNGGVKRQSRDSISGNYVVLDHGLGIETVYCHLDSAGVVEGTRVRRKEIVGLSGSTGRVTGPHLHYIVRVHDKPIDPEKVGESPTRGGGLSDPPPPVPPEKAPEKPKPVKPKTAKGAKAADPKPADPKPADPKPTGGDPI